MFPLYLLAAQANLGLARARQCENLLAMACWLGSKFPDQTTHVMMSQLHRLYGQLYALQGQHEKALHAFAEDVYCCSQEYGPYDVRTSLGFYNLGKVFETMKNEQASRANYALVTTTWLNAMIQVSLGMIPAERGATILADDHGQKQLPLGKLQLVEVSAPLFVNAVLLCSWVGHRQPFVLTVCSTLIDYDRTAALSLAMCMRQQYDAALYRSSICLPTLHQCAKGVTLPRMPRHQLLWHGHRLARKTGRAKHVLMPRTVNARIRGCARS
jgi:hypothetical protein